MQFQWSQFPYVLLRVHFTGSAFAFRFATDKRMGNVHLFSPIQSTVAVRSKSHPEATAQGGRAPLGSVWMWMKAWEAFPLTLNWTVLVFEAIKYLMFPLITCMRNNGIWRELWQQFSGGKDYLIFRGNLTGDFRANKNACSRPMLWRDGIRTHFAIET